MLLDFRTLSLMVVISSVLYAVTIAFFALQANQYQGIKAYMWGAICAAIGFLAGAIYSAMPELVFLRFVATEFLIIAPYLYCIGIANFLDFKPHYLLLSGILFSAFVSISYFGLFKTTVVFGNAVTPVYGIIFYSIACYYLWQRREENFSRSIFFMLANLIFIIMVFILRCYVVIALEVKSSFTNHPLNNGFLLVVFISGYLRNVGFIVMVSHRLYEDLRAAAFQDFLTKLYNRRATQQYLEQQFNLFKRHRFPCSLILLDIDHFKAVNDNYGHEIGDQVLQTIASTLKAQLRKTDILGRWGGEEFLVLLPNTRIKHACEVAEKLREKIQTQPINELFCTISSGVKMLDEDDLSADMAVKRTDDALYEAKHLGRNRVVIYKNLPS